MTQLDALFVSGDEVDQGLVVGILSPFLRVDRDSCSIVPNERWLKVNNKLKIVLFLIARKAMKLRGLPIDNEGALPSEIEEGTGVKGGSIRPRLKSLLEEKVINRTKDGKYFVPNYSLMRIKAMMDTQVKEG